MTVTGVQSAFSIYAMVMADESASAELAEVYSLSRNLATSDRVCVLAVNSDRWLWLRALWRLSSDERFSIP